MPITVLDHFSSGSLAPEIWRTLALPAGDGAIWVFQDPGVRIQAEGGVLEASIERFRLSHDHVQMFDNPKLLVVMQQPVPLSVTGVTTISWDMACENHNGNPDDLLDGFVALSLGDFETGMVFDFIMSGTRIGVVYERLALPGVTPAGGDWIHVVQSPLLAQSAPGEFQHYEIRFDRAARSCEWWVDGRRMYAVSDIPVDVKSVTPGVGLLTLRPLESGKGSVSNHGQGATGRWRNLVVQG
ncbi:PE-PGRS family protein [Cupriavidus basilensis OR16]|uniref:PE-PGRS family protein n=1 Tax=Cupriavidus basilensis OR16 TaxID=1127483 RepID=H1S8N2_9BURK|nr:DUF6081 family protein [Cupriavidus basilensis]EHP41074.1 PE-PGRS family protein [Cupriavidus basilensis OR16]